MAGLRFIFCDDDTCKYSNGSVCTKEEIHVSIRYGMMEQGRLTVHNTCQDYEGKEDAGTD